MRALTNGPAMSSGRFFFVHYYDGATMSRLDVPSTHGLFFETRSEKPRGIIARSDAGSRARVYDALLA